jgi:hypothetical protein
VPAFPLPGSTAGRGAIAERRSSSGQHEDAMQPWLGVGGWGVATPPGWPRRQPGSLLTELQTLGPPGQGAVGRDLLYVRLLTVMISHVRDGNVRGSVSDNEAPAV